jgi:hypothetical protein
VVRDIIDLEAAADLGGYSFIDLENLGRRHEPEFDLRKLADQLDAVSWFSDEDFAAYGLDQVRMDAVRRFAHRWHLDAVGRVAEQEALEEEF